MPGIAMLQCRYRPSAARQADSDVASDELFLLQSGQLSRQFHHFADRECAGHRPRSIDMHDRRTREQWQTTVTGRGRLDRAGQVVHQYQSPRACFILFPTGDGRRRRSDDAKTDTTSRRRSPREAVTANTSSRSHSISQLGLDRSVARCVECATWLTSQPVMVQRDLFTPSARRHKAMATSPPPHATSSTRSCVRSV